MSCIYAYSLIWKIPMVYCSEKKIVEQQISCNSFHVTWCVCVELFGRMLTEVLKVVVAPGLWDLHKFYFLYSSLIIGLTIIYDSVYESMYMIIYYFYKIKRYPYFRGKKCYNIAKLHLSYLILMVFFLPPAKHLIYIREA